MQIQLMFNGAVHQHAGKSLHLEGPALGLSPYRAWPWRLADSAAICALSNVSLVWIAGNDSAWPQVRYPESVTGGLVTVSGTILANGIGRRFSVLHRLTTRRHECTNLVRARIRQSHATTYRLAPYGASHSEQWLRPRFLRTRQAKSERPKPAGPICA